jgi:PilZ domain-containing protein
MTDSKPSMANKAGFQLEPRYRQRIRLSCPVRFTAGDHVGKGQLLDLTIPGCLIESTDMVPDAQSLHLELFLPGLTFPLSVPLGVVRWRKGKQFGVEFIKMHPSQQEILRRFMTKHL